MEVLSSHYLFQRLCRFLPAALALCLLADLRPAHAAAREATEAEVKAAYLYNFGLFTQWPKKAFKAADSPFVIGILGEDPFGEEINEIAATETVNKRRIQIVRAPSGAPPPECHLLYVSASEKERFKEILESLKGQPVLTVSDDAPFCRLGGAIRFTRTSSKLGLVINPAAARAAGLRISPDLLAIAQIERTRKVEQ